MAKSTKPAKAAPKAKVEVEPEAPRLNRYARSAAIIASDLGIEAEALSQQADMSMSTARHCREAWNWIVGELLTRGALTPEWAAIINEASAKELASTTPEPRNEEAAA
jgi:hypothetical protein